MRAIRALTLGLVATLLAVLGSAVMPAAYACACGAFVAGDGEDFAASSEYAALSWDGTTERVLLSMNALTSTAEGALLIPTPAPAQADLAAAETFTELDQITAPEVVIDYRWFPDYGLDSGGAPGQGNTGAAVSVLETRQLGNLEVSVLSATDANELTDWLAEHDYVMADTVAEALAPYIAGGWYYLAVRLTTDAATLSGALQPLDITFDSDQLVYPMRLSAAATSSQFVRTYVFAEQRVMRTDETSTQGTSTLRFAGPVTASDFTSPQLAQLAGQHPYLTAIDQFFYDPSQQIVSDFTFAPNAEAGDYRITEHEVRYYRLFGVPAGPVLVLLGAIVAVVAAAIVVVVLVRRHSRRPAG